MRKIRNWVLIFFWECIYLIQSLPHLFFAKERRGPDFIIIGASKSGTTFLYEELAKHPDIKRARMKEPRFYNRYHFLGLTYYRSFFPKRKKTCLSGEATTSYFYNAEVPAKVKSDFPQVKLILLLRNPIYRAYAHFQMNKKDEPNSSFIEALRNEGKGESSYFYLASSLYAKNLRLWQQYFSNDQIHIIKSEKLFSQTKETLNELYDFLGIENREIDQFEKVNQGNYQVLSAEEYKRALPYFEEDMRELRNMLGSEFKWEIV